MAKSGDAAQIGAPNAVAVAVSGSDTVVKNTYGRIGTIVVTATGANPLQVYDNASAGSGLIIAALPASPAIGAYPMNMPAALGITVKGSATNPAVTISFW